MAGRVDFVNVTNEDIEGQAKAPRQGTRWYWKMRMVNFDAAGIVAHMMLRKTTKDPEVILDLTEANGRITWESRGSGSTDAVLIVNVWADDMAAVLPRTYRHDLELSPGGDQHLTYAMIYGDVLIQAEVTR